MMRSRNAFDYLVSRCLKIINLVAPRPNLPNLRNPPLAPTEKAPYLLRNNSRTGPSKRLAPKDSFHYAGT